MLDLLIDGARARSALIAGDRERLEREAAALPVARDLAAALRGPGLAVIAEIKRRSPSAGPIAPDLDPGNLAASYAAGGASALSVLTEPEHFGAMAGDLGAARARVRVPVLRKDFLVDAVQVWEARAMGADAVLLIAAALDDAALRLLVAEAASAGLGVLVEAHTAAEVERALAAGAPIVGVNNRDLSTFTVDLETAERLRPLIPDGTVAVAESGVSTPATAGRMRALGYDAVLVGEAAARAADPASFIASLREAA